MARNKRVGGVSSWRKASDPTVAYRPSAAQVKDRDLLQTNQTVPEFEDEASRYGWEMEQWRHATITKRRWRKWFGADEHWHVGPPIPPDAPLFQHPIAQRAFKMANEEGYMAPRMVGEAIGIGRYEAKRLLDTVNGRLNVGFVQYPHRVLKQTIWNCRMLHEDAVKELGENLDYWRGEMKKKFKNRDLPRPGERMQKFMGE